MHQKGKKFHVGDRVLNPRFGPGTIVDQWGAFLITTPKGKPIAACKKGMFDCTDVYEVQFAQHIGSRSVNADRLIHL